MTVVLNDAMYRTEAMTPERQSRVIWILTVGQMHENEKFSRWDLMRWCKWDDRNRFEADLMVARKEARARGWNLSNCAPGEGNLMTFTKDTPSEITHLALASAAKRVETLLTNLGESAEWAITNGVIGQELMEAVFYRDASRAALVSFQGFHQMAEENERLRAQLEAAGLAAE